MKIEKKFLLSLVCLALAGTSAWADGDNESSNVEVKLDYSTKGTSATVIGFSDEMSEEDMESVTDVSIPATVEIENETYNVVAIKSRAFIGYNIETVSIPSSVTSIGSKAFASCSKLKTVSITSEDGDDEEGGNGTSGISDDDETGVDIGQEAFSSCSSLTTFELTNIASVGASAFAYCGLTSIDLSTATSIGASAFYGSKLSSVTLGSDAEISAFAFAGCAFTSIDLSNVKSAGSDAFAECTSLTTITFPTTDNEGSFSFGEDVTGLFRGCLKLATIENLGSLSEIPDSTFYDCISLATIDLDGVTKIGKAAFADCAFETLTIPASVTEIGENAFAGCSKLAEVDCTAERESVATCNSGAFSEVVEDCELLVAEGKADDYSSWGIDNIRETAVAITITKYAYATYYNTYEYTIDNADFQAAIVPEVDSDGTIHIEWRYGLGTYESNGTTYSQSATVPVGTACLVRTTTNETIDETNGITYTFDTSKATAEKVTGNYLYGSDTAGESCFALDENGNKDTTNTYYYYMLSVGNSGSGVGFYPYNSDFEAFSYKAHQAWLAIPASVFGTDEETGEVKAIAGFSLSNGETTGIKVVETSSTVAPATDAIYNLQGVRVSDMSQKGIYIVNGKKVIKK